MSTICDKFRVIILTIVVLLAMECNSQIDSGDRQPAVAGRFYPASSADLNATLNLLFSKALPSKNFKNVLAVISPHAGYVFSGIVAASGFNQINTENQYDNVFILASSHTTAFEGASIYVSGDFIAPLGKVKVNKVLGKRLMKASKVFSDRTDAHITEHSIEVQLPFLQYKLKKDFNIVPIVLGGENPKVCKSVAEALSPYFNSQNLFVISTDFSHYPSHKNAQAVDAATTDAILSNSPETLLKTLQLNEHKGIPGLATSLCGWTAVLTLMYITQSISDITYSKIHYMNSGDSDYGEKNSVVGYVSIIISKKDNMEEQTFKLDERDKRDLLSIARRTLEYYIPNRELPKIDQTKFSKSLQKNCGAFVTFHKQGNLRGCIGRFDAVEPLFKVVQEMAVASATQDYRFTPVQQNEIKELEIEISVLTPLQRINSADEFILGKHGIYIKKGGRTGTFLPQVATETGWTKEEFLGHCAQDKAGIGWNGWKDSELYVYEAIIFSEKELSGK